MFTENPSIAQRNGLINPEHLFPVSKNPTIARVFREAWMADELGSGVCKTYEYGEIYSDGQKPQFIDGDIFCAIIPLKFTPKLPPQALKEVEQSVMEFCGVARTREEIMNHIGIHDCKHFRTNILQKRFYLYDYPRFS